MNSKLEELRSTANRPTTTRHLQLLCSLWHLVLPVAAARFFGGGGGGGGGAEMNFTYEK